MWEHRNGSLIVTYCDELQAQVNVAKRKRKTLQFAEIRRFQQQERQHTVKNFR